MTSQDPNDPPPSRPDRFCIKEFCQWATFLSAEERLALPVAFDNLHRVAAKYGKNMYELLDAYMSWKKTQGCSTEPSKRD